MAEDSPGTILWLMKHAFARQRRSVEDAMRAHGITATQAGVLTQLHVSPGLSSSDMARRLIITPQAVMAAVELAREAGAPRAIGRPQSRPDPAVLSHR